MPLTSNARIQRDFGVGEAIGSFNIWLLLAIVAMGLAIIVYYYMMAMKVLNRAEIAGIAAGQEPAACCNPR